MNDKGKQLILWLRIWICVLYLSAQIVFAQRVGIQWIDLLIIDLSAIPLLLMWRCKCPPIGREQ